MNSLYDYFYQNAILWNVDVLSKFKRILNLSKANGYFVGNLVLRAHVPFGPCLGADQKARGLWERDCFVGH